MHLPAGENISSFDCPESVHTMGSGIVYPLPLTEQIHYPIPDPKCVAIFLTFYASIEKHYRQCFAEDTRLSVKDHFAATAQ
jgi:hypothetical protein